MKYIREDILKIKNNNNIVAVTYYLTENINKIKTIPIYTTKR